MATLEGGGGRGGVRGKSRGGGSSPSPPPPLQELPETPPLPLIQLPGVQEFRVYKPDLEVYKLNLRGMLILRPFQCTISICLMNSYWLG